MITGQQKAYFILSHAANRGISPQFWERLGRFGGELGLNFDGFVTISKMSTTELNHLLNAMLGAFFNPECENENHREVQFLSELHCSVCSYCGHIFDKDLRMGDLDASEHEFPTEAEK